MVETLRISSLPDWKHAGKRAEGVIHSKPPQTEPSEFPVVLADSALYKIVNGYLVPHYEPREHSRQLRKQELVADRVQKFFYSVKPGLDAKRDKQSLAQEFKNFDILYGKIIKENPEFSLSTPYRLLSRSERELVNRGAALAGHAVNRLGRLGQVILQEDKTGIDIEYDDQFIKEHMDDIKEEFSLLYKDLISSKHEDLARCIISRDKRVDHDGIFSYFMHEIGKIINDDTSPMVKKLEQEATEAKVTAEAMPSGPEREEALASAKALRARTESMRERMENFTRHGIVTNIGFALEAIDQTSAQLEVILQHKLFGDYLNRTQKMVENTSRPLEPATKDIDVREYRGLLHEYVDLCRARACIRSEDAINFNPVSERISFLESELGLYHEIMFRAADITRNQTAEEATSLLKRGVSLIGEMSELRLPRNHNAPCVYDKNNPAFEGKDASSVGRLTEKIQRLKEGKLQGVELDF